MVIRILIAILLICGAVGAQEKTKDESPLKTGHFPVVRDASVSGLTFSSSALSISIGSPPITIDGESTDCTQAHLIKALKIATAGLKDPNEWPPNLLYSGGTYVYPEYYGYFDTRAPAERLRAEADRLEVESKRVQWVRNVLKACESK